ncbi:MAG: hypothetical protein AAF840_16560 [Bacteroidota bacterium]
MKRLLYFFRRLKVPFLLGRIRLRRLATLLQRIRSWRSLLDVLFALADLLGVFDLYEAITNTFFPNTRGLTPEEYHLLFPIFADSIPYHLIRIDERAYLGPSWARFYYVSFNTINSWGPMRDPILIHEAVHIWQYCRHGAAYIPRALYAQFTPEGYNYGGLEPLRANTKLEDFNYEQQADIIEDAFRLANGYQAQWVRGAGAEILPDYYPYLEELRRSKYPD